MNLLQQLLSTLHCLQASDKATLNSYSDLNKQGPFVYPFGGAIFLEFSQASQAVKGKYSDEDLIYKGAWISAN